MKAIIEVARHGLDEALEIARRFDAGEAVPEADYYLRFDSAPLLFSRLTGTRLALLDRLRRLGPCSVYALARSAGRNYSNVHRDVAVLASGAGAGGVSRRVFLRRHLIRNMPIVDAVRGHRLVAVQPVQNRH